MTDQLLYFNLRARGEAIRMLYVVAGKEFEDKTYTIEEWPKHKPGNRDKIGKYRIEGTGHSSQSYTGTVGYRSLGLCGGVRLVYSNLWL